MHTLIIGGTGMLAEASVSLASCCETLTLVARSKSSLSAIDKKLEATKCHRHLLALDWSNHTDYVDSISQHIMSVGAPNLVLAWVHRERLAFELVAMIAPHTACTDFFHVRGSAAANPNRDAGSITASNITNSHLDYHEIILGFKLTDSCTGPAARWLSHKEISAGVLLAIDNPKSRRIVGTVQPWSSRPG